MSIIPQELTVKALREMYHQGKTTPQELMENIIQRANKDVDMNIWITPPDMDWIKPYLDRLSELDPADAPLWGVPFAIKDNIDLAGIPTTAGCPDYTYTPTQHAAVVERLLDAGAIPVGKTNLDQFATGLVGTRSPYGETHNSLRSELISGGSSAGSPVAVARGQATFALGTDTAGSGRVPAALNNLVGYKPSLGAWSTKGVVPACESLDCVTVFVNSLADAHIVDESARGVEPLDPWSRPLPVPTPKQPEKLCLPKDPLEFYGPFAHEYEKAWNDVLEKLKGLDITIEYVDTALFSEAAAILYGGPWIAERWAALGEFVESHPGATYSATEKVLRSGAGDKYNAASVFQAMHKLQKLKLEAKELLKQSVLALPTCGGTWTREQVRENPISTNNDMGRYTNHCNLLDLGAIAIPAGEAETDTPFGITLFSLADQEEFLWGTADVFMNEQEQGSFATTLIESKENTTFVAVCGLHMRGFPLEKQMQECGATFVKETKTAPKYNMVELPTEPAKPGLIKKNEGGASIPLEVWEMPLSTFGHFTASIPSPLGMGTVELEDGSEVPGFICEEYAARKAKDITSLGGWRQVVAQE